MVSSFLSSVRFEEFLEKIVCSSVFFAIVYKQLVGSGDLRPCLDKIISGTSDPKLVGTNLDRGPSRGFAVHSVISFFSVRYSWHFLSTDPVL